MTFDMPRRSWIPIILFLVVINGLIFGFYKFSRRQEENRRRQAKESRYYEKELERARDSLQDTEKRSQKKLSSTVFAETKLDYENLQGVEIVSDTNAFQRASFVGTKLDGATLTGGPSSFQLANFNSASLRKAKLTGENASFQHATFNNADLTNAELTGNFQVTSFENATLVGAVWSGSFQSCNISGASFAAADLTGVETPNLASCYFKQQPTYDEETSFPTGFDPDEQGWQNVSE